MRGGGGSVGGGEILVFDEGMFGTGRGMLPTTGGGVVI